MDRFVSLNEKLKTENMDVELIISPKQKYFTKPWTEQEPNLTGNWSYQSAFESIFLKSKLLDLDMFFILEDDIFFAENYIDKFTNFYSKIPTDWQILHLDIIIVLLVLMEFLFLNSKRECMQLERMLLCINEMYMIIY